jgi:glycosyltransferase involved in cell wall biosynthesis
VIDSGPNRPPRRIRLTILDDNPFVALPDGEIRPRAATFHRFAAAVVAAGPFERARYLIPVAQLRAHEGSPSTAPVDPSRLDVVPTASFKGVAGFLARAPILARRNWPLIRDAISGSDLVLVKAPASNSLFALVAARRARVPLVTWVAGSARAVVGGQRRSLPGAVAATVAAIGYDAVTWLLGQAGPSATLDAELFTSIVTDAEVAATRARRRSNADPLALAWAGRIVADKGLDDLMRALRLLRQRGHRPTLQVLGDGADRERLMAMATASDIDADIRWHGFVGDRDVYLDVLRRASMLVLPSRAEGVPKVALDAMAAGIPVIATRVGAVAALLADGRGVLVPPRDPTALADAITNLAGDLERRRQLARAGLDFVEAHTIDRQAGRVVQWLRTALPRLPWPDAQESLDPVTLPVSSR